MFVCQTSDIYWFCHHYRKCIIDLLKLLLVHSNICSISMLLYLFIIQIIDLNSIKVNVICHLFSSSLIIFLISMWNDVIYDFITCYSVTPLLVHAYSSLVITWPHTVGSIIQCIETG